MNIKREINQQDVERWLIERLAVILNTNPDKLSLSESITDFGLESIEGFTIAGDLSDWLGQKFSPTLVWEYSTISKLSEHIITILKK